MKFSVLFATLLLSASALASKSRVNSLLGADHLVDTQTVFTVPSHIQLLNPYLTFEMGAQGAGAEGGIMRKVGENNLLVYVGHQNTTAILAQDDIRTANSYLGQNNPIEVIYGTGNMGFGASVSTVKNDTAGTKETTVIGKWGMNFNALSWAWVHAHLVSQAEKTTAGATDKMTASPYLSGGLSWQETNVRYFGRLDIGNGKEDLAAGADRDVKDMAVTIGLEDRSLKTDAADIYYGFALAYGQRKYESVEISAYTLPVFAGIEAPVLSWLTARASVRQNAFIGETKSETTTPSTKSGIASNTLVSAGLGFKHGSFALDGSLTAAGNGDINGNQFLTQSSFTYNF